MARSVAAVWHALSLAKGVRGGLFSISHIHALRYAKGVPHVPRRDNAGRGFHALRYAQGVPHGFGRMLKSLYSLCHHYVYRVVFTGGMVDFTERKSRLISNFRQFRVSTPTAANGNHVRFSDRSQCVVRVALCMVWLP